MVKPRFISIGVSIALRSLLLAVIVAAGSFYFIRLYLQQQLITDINELSDRDWHQFQQQVKTTFNYQLSLIETLQFSASDDDSRATLVDLKETLERNWDSLVLINGMEQINLYDARGKLYHRFGNLEFRPAPEVLTEVTATGEPRASFQCDFNCYFVILMPVLLNDGSTISMLMAVPAYPILDYFFSIAGASGSMGRMTDAGQLVPFNMNTPLLSYKELLDLTSTYNRQQKSGSRPVVINRSGDEDFTLNLRLITDKSSNQPLYLFWKRDVTQLVNASTQTTEFALIFMSIAGVVLFLSIIIFHRNLTSRTHLLAEVLPLLTTSDFPTAFKKLAKNKPYHWFFDEIDILFDTSRQVTQKLQELGEQLEEQNRNLHRMAYRDSLTKLPNRMSFYESLGQHLRSLSRQDSYLGLLFIDVDGFKAINDNLGHSAGDFYLTTLADRLNQSIRQADTAFRLAGDEFVILASNLKSEADMQTLADKILQEATRPMQYKGQKLATTVSIGGIMTNNHNLQPDYFLSRADEAMYSSKNTGKGKYSFAGII